MVDEQGWERHDPREQGPNLDEYSCFLHGLIESGGDVGVRSGNDRRDSEATEGWAEDKEVVMIDDEGDEMVVEGGSGSEDDAEESENDDQGGSDYEPYGSGGEGWN